MQQKTYSDEHNPPPLPHMSLDERFDSFAGFFDAGGRVGCCKVFFPADGGRGDGAGWVDGLNGNGGGFAAGSHFEVGGWLAGGGMGWGEQYYGRGVLCYVGVCLWAQPFCFNVEPRDNMHTWYRAPRFVYKLGKGIFIPPAPTPHPPILGTTIAFFGEIQGW